MAEMKMKFRIMVSRIRGAHIRQLQTSNGPKDYILIPVDNGVLRHSPNGEWFMDANYYNTKEVDGGGRKKCIGFAKPKLTKFLYDSLTKDELNSILPIAYLLDESVMKKEYIQKENSR